MATPIFQLGNEVTSNMSTDSASALASLQANITCPHCWFQFPPYDTKWISVHPSLQDDPKVPEGHRRFLPTQCDISGQAIDAKGESCSSWLVRDVI